MNLKKRFLLFFLITGSAALLLAGSISGTGATESKYSAEMKEQFYKQAKHLMTRQEMKFFKRIRSKTAMKSFIKYFWEVRDPSPMTAENEFRVEIQKRFEFVQRHFREGPRPGWKSDRGWIYMIFGAPEQEEKDAQGMVIVWYYGYSGSQGWRPPGGGFILVFRSRNALGEYRLNQNAMSLRVLDLMETMKYNMIVKKGEDAEFSPGPRCKLAYDGKTSQVWVSFGPKNVVFDRSEKKIGVSFHVDLLAYLPGRDISKFSRDWEIFLDEKELLEKDFEFRIPVDVKLAPGKYGLEAVLTDTFSGKKSRCFSRIKVRDK